MTISSHQVGNSSKDIFFDLNLINFFFVFEIFNFNNKHILILDISFKSGGLLFSIHKENINV